MHLVMSYTSYVIKSTNRILYDCITNDSQTRKFFQARLSQKANSETSSQQQRQATSSSTTNNQKINADFRQDPHRQDHHPRR